MPVMEAEKVLVAGALGVVGRAVVERLAAKPDYRVVGLARRAPDAGLVESLRSAANPVEWIRCDLFDAEATRRALAPHRDASRLVFAALHEKPQLVRGWFEPDHVDHNAALLRNTLGALDGGAVSHVTLLQGTKAYGAHAGHAMRIPARESDAIRDPRTFYFAQQDLLEASASQAGFAWTILRPQIVLGVAVGSAMNPVAALGAYAVILREEGSPLFFPGHPRALAECTDARIVASAVEWAFREPRAWGEAINVANGDVIVWRSFFDRLALLFGLKVVEQPVRVAEAMPARAALWRRIAEREGLRIADLDALIGLSWQYSDVLWANPEPPAMPSLVSTIKARQLGFGDCIDSEECIVEHLEAMRRLAYLPRV
jgi:nucleoside-diphosphate-sugar epimerase